MFIVSHEYDNDRFETVTVTNDLGKAKSAIYNHVAPRLQTMAEKNPKWNDNRLAEVHDHLIEQYKIEAWEMHGSERLAFYRFFAGNLEQW